MMKKMSHHRLTFVSTAFFLWGLWYLQLSATAYILVGAFLVLHITGIAYTYHKVPFGKRLGLLVGSQRNMYDRLVHFAFGLLIVEPIREILDRYAGTSPGWTAFFSLIMIFAISAVFEIFEWFMWDVAKTRSKETDPEPQGDEWDAQKDMALASLGSVLGFLVAWAEAYFG